MRRAVAVAVAIAAASSARARADDPRAGCARANLLALSPPVAGYSSVDGVIYDAAPLGYERALTSRGGLRLTPTAIVSAGAVQWYALFLGLPFYLRSCREGSPYGGAYAAPLVGGWVDRLPVEHRELGAGGEVGWAWSFGERWRLTAGVWGLLAFDDLDASTSGLSLALGLWL